MMLMVCLKHLHVIPHPEAKLYNTMMPLGRLSHSAV